MDREQAISYLERKGKIREAETEVITKEVEYTEEEEQEIKEVMKHGKIYGDPVVELY